YLFRAFRPPRFEYPYLQSHLGLSSDSAGMLESLFDALFPGFGSGSGAHSTVVGALIAAQEQTSHARCAFAGLGSTSWLIPSTPLGCFLGHSLTCWGFGAGSVHAGAEYNLRNAKSGRGRSGFDYTITGT